MRVYDGLLMASWATRTPAIRDILSVSTAEMGIVLFGLSDFETRVGLKVFERTTRHLALTQFGESLQSSSIYS
jgi:hypothetical protein